MYESTAELEALEDLLRRSRARSTEHLRSIFGDDRSPDAAEVVARCASMCTLSVATVTARGEPRVAALDGHFLHGTWTFSTSASSAKARHLARRPAVSVAFIDGETFALFSHGTAQQLAPGDGCFEETLEHWTRHYGASPLSWGDVVMYRLRPTWMVGYRSEPG
jgi:hypothetical protein